MRIGSVVYATRQGLGTLGKSFYDGGLITDIAIFRHGSYQTHKEWYPPETLELVGRPFNGPKVDKWLEPLDWVLFFETPFDWDFPQYCRDRGKKTALIPMYEWFPRSPKHKFDLIAAPSVLDEELISGSKFLPIPVPQGTWQQRATARKFLHNAGHIGYHEHKGTREILKAMRFVTKSIDITIRCQPEAGPRFQQMCMEEGYRLPVTTFPESKAVVRLVTGEFAGPRLYDTEYDVFVMAEKYNGLSLPLAEARAAGMLVVTSDRVPMNTWLPKEYLIRVEKYYPSCISGAYLDFMEAEVNPLDIAAKLDEIFDTDISQVSLAGKMWAEENSWDKLLPVWKEALS